MNNYIRTPEHDRRIHRGDDFAGDAWEDIFTGKIRYVAVGYNPNGTPPIVPISSVDISIDMSGWD